MQWLCGHVDSKKYIPSELNIIYLFIHLFMIYLTALSVSSYTVMNETQ
jgi:hypothetical protein